MLLAPVTGLCKRCVPDSLLHCMSQAALLSTMVHGGKGADNVQSSLPDYLAAPLRELQAASRWVASVVKDANLPIDTEEYVHSFVPDMMEVVYAWVEGAKFVDVCAMTTAFEGTVIRVVRRLEELLRQLADAAKVCV